MRLIWTRRATHDLVEIRSYIARDNPPAALRIAARIRQAIAHLAVHPNLGRVGREPGTRELVVSRTRYVVAYSVQEELGDDSGRRPWRATVAPTMMPTMHAAEMDQLDDLYEIDSCRYLISRA